MYNQYYVIHTELCSSPECVVVLQLLSYGGFLNLSLVEGNSDYVHYDLLLEVKEWDPVGGASAPVTDL